VRGWLRRKGEPFRWAIARERISPFLERHGLSLQRTYAAAEIREHAPDRRVAEGEVIIVAE
jgi:hypothetical protein